MVAPRNHGTAVATPAAGPSVTDLIEQTYRIIRRQSIPLLICSLLGLAWGLYVVATTRISYTAYTTLLLENRRVRAVQDATAFARDGDVSEAGISSQIEILRSEKLAEWVLRQLGPTQETSAPQPTGGRGLAAVLGRVRAMLGAPRTQPSALEARQAEIDAVRFNLGVRRIARTQLVELYYTSPDAATAARMVNLFADSYLNDMVETQVEATTRAGTWLRSQLNELKDAVQQSELAVQKFKASNQMVSAGGRLVDDQKLYDITTQLSLLRSDTLRLETRYQTIKGVIDTNQIDAPLPEAIGSPAVEAQRSKYILAAKGEREMARRLGADHATVVRLRAEMRDYARQTLQELKRLAESSRNELEIARARERALMEHHASLANTNSVLNETMVQLRELERRAETLKATYATALQRYQEAIQQQSFPSTEVRVVAKATPPAYPNPRRAVPTLIFALALGGLAGAGIGALRELFDDTVRTKRQAEAIFGLGPARLLPMLPPQPAGHHLDYVLDNPRSELGEKLQALKVAIDAHTAGRTSRVIGVVSVVPGEGSTTVAKNLASLIASTGAPTLLIDADLRHPTLSRLLAPETKQGLAEAIKEGKNSGHLRSEPRSGLSILPLALDDTWTPPVGLLASAGMRDLLKDAESYAYVLIDLPSLATVSDAAAMAPLVDGFLLVTAWGRTRAKQIEGILADQSPVHEKAIAVAVTGVDMRRLGRYEAPAPKPRRMT